MADEKEATIANTHVPDKLYASIQKSGRNPALLKSLIMTAIYALELLIGKVFKMASQKADYQKKI